MSLGDCLSFVHESYSKILLQFSDSSNLFEENVLYEYSTEYDDEYFIKVNGKVYLMDRENTFFSEFIGTKKIMFLIRLIGTERLPRDAFRYDISFPDGLENGKKYVNQNGRKIIFREKRKKIFFVEEEEENICPLSLVGNFRKINF